MIRVDVQWANLKFNVSLTLLEKTAVADTVKTVVVNQLNQLQTPGAYEKVFVRLLPQDITAIRHCKLESNADDTVASEDLHQVQCSTLTDVNFHFWTFCSFCTKPYTLWMCTTWAAALLERKIYYASMAVMCQLLSSYMHRPTP